MAAAREREKERERAVDAKKWWVARSALLYGVYRAERGSGAPRVPEVSLQFVNPRGDRACHETVTAALRRRERNTVLTASLATAIGTFERFRVSSSSRRTNEDSLAPPSGRLQVQAVRRPVAVVETGIVPNETGTRLSTLEKRADLAE